MCAAHKCIRSALTQAFRLSQHRLAQTWTVPEFLAPALTRPLHPSLSSRRQLHTESQAPHQTIVEPPNQSSSPPHQPSNAKERLLCRIPLPDGPHDRSDIQSWLAAIDPFLPPDLRRTTSENTENLEVATPLDFALAFNAAQDVSHDLLGYMGFVEGRWDTAVWLVKKLAEDGARVLQPPAQLQPFANVIWPESNSRSLDDLTNGPLLTQRVRPPRKLNHSLDDLIAAPDSINHKHNVAKRALGQVWRSLGNIILSAVARDEPKMSAVLSRVLEMIAHLHHVGLIPESVYQYLPAYDDFALQQPPTLDLLSAKIFTALSDATWRAYEASAKNAKERMNAQYFLGREIPGSRFTAYVSGIAPELWLELILWSCLHGGWVLDGTAILEKILLDREKIGWRLISWRQLVQKLEKESTPTLFGWRLFQGRDMASHNEGHALIQRTISSEVVTAFIDGLANAMRVGVGARGTDPETLLAHIENLKQLLDLDSLSLGSISWDSIIVRLLESGGIVPEKRPALLLSMIKLASNFGTEVGSPNAPSGDVDAIPEPPYFFDPSAVSIGLLHRTMQSFIENGDISGSMATFQSLQQYTDENKQRSLRQFFERLNSSLPQQDQPFTGNIAPIDYPGFDTQLPKPLLAKTLDLITESKLFDLGSWLLSSKDLDGPLIDNSMYHNWHIAAAIIRFGTATQSNDLVLKAVDKATVGRSAAQMMPPEILTALLSSQIQQHRWASVQSIQQYVVENPGYWPHPVVLANFAATLLRTSNDIESFTESPKVEAQVAFKEFLFAWEATILTRLRNELYCVLAIVSSINDDWKVFCSTFLAFSARQGIRLSTFDFNIILGGVLDAFGSTKGRMIVNMWCYRPPNRFEPYRAPGGLPTMPQFRVSKGEEHESKPDDIIITQPSGATLILQGRVYPNRQTVLAVLRKVQQELDQIKESGREQTTQENVEFRETLEWAEDLLYYLGFDYDDLVRDLGSLAKPAQLKAPASPRIFGLPDEEIR